MIPVPKRDWQVYAALAGLSILVTRLMWFRGTFDLVSFDGTYYINQAKALWSSAPQPGSFPLGYPFFISLFLPLVGDGVRAAQLVSFLASLGTLFVLFALARRYVDRRMAFYCAAFLAITPLFVRLSLETFSESLFVFWMLFALWLFARGRDAASGVAAGVASITRPEMLGVAGVLFVLRLRAPRRAMLFILPLIVIYSFNALKFYQSNGQLTVLPKSEFFGTGAQDWIEREQTVDEITADARNADTGQPARSGERPGTSASKPSLSQVAINYVTKLPYEIYLLARNVGFLALILTVYGMIRRPTFLLVALLPFVIGPLFTVRSMDRYLLQYVPVILLYAFVGAESLEKTKVKRYIPYALGLSAVLAIAFNFGHLTRPVDDNMREAKEAGLYLRAHILEGDVIADRKPYVAFYAGAQYVEIPNDSYEGTMNYLIGRDARFLSLHTRIIKKLRPLMTKLVVDRAVVAGELRFKQVWGHEEGLVVYQRVRDADPARWTRIHNPSRGMDSSPDWSPDGERIAFGSKLGKDFDVFVVSADGGEPELLAGGPFHEDQPDWSPDGELVAFSSNRAGNWDVYTIDPATGEVRMLTEHKANDAAPAWTPDGRAIVFMSERSGSQELWKLDLANGRLTQLTRGGDNNFPAVSPDGSRVAWTNANRGLVVMDLSTGEATVVPSPKEVNYAPSWSPDSRFIAVTGRDWGSVDLYLVTADGAQSLLLTKNALPGPDVMFDALPSWAPDGGRLALISNKEGPQSLYVLDGLQAYLDRLENPTKMLLFEVDDE